MDRQEDSFFDWGEFDENRCDNVERALNTVTENILVLSHRIAEVAGLPFDSPMPRREELLDAMNARLDEFYIELDRFSKIKSMRDLHLPQTVKEWMQPTRRPRIPHKQVEDEG
jgi:antitoxin component of RelBE/YafQ-DinJ toxin-antitoxin module